MVEKPSRDVWKIDEGAPWPLGATWIQSERSYNFALYSKNAERVILMLYSDHDFVNPVVSIPLEFPKHKTSRCWHARVRAADIGDAKYYAYAVDGPVGPGQRFDSNKILLDPYARGVFFPPNHDRTAACGPGSNAGQAPLGVLPSRVSMRRSGRSESLRHRHDLVIYEMHVRGFTMSSNSVVEANRRGTFAGVIEMVPHLKELGVTAVELLPVHQFDPAEGNYWGYMTLSFFGAHLGYSVAKEAHAAVREFRRMVDVLHSVGIEVFLDVVYNHTTEAGNLGPTYSFRGIDNQTYYVLASPEYDQFVDFSGCGNDLRTAHAVVRRLVMDSLRYWAVEMGVDGFRFDLASIFARTETGSLDLEDPPLVSEMSSEPTLQDIRLIAEPWQGTYGDGYLMGQTFPGKTWRQWNDHFRDDIRKFVKGDLGLVRSVMTRLYGSTDFFPDTLETAFRRSQSVNYIDCHDGMCLYDLVSYTDDIQRSWNCGHEGDYGTPQAVIDLRKQQVKNFCCLLMLSNGTPMFCAGDEFMHSQGGNSNPWNQDNSSTWIDWTRKHQNPDVFRFFKLMIAFRKNHPLIGRDTGWNGDVHWHGVCASVDTSTESQSFAYFLDGRSVRDDDIYVMINCSRQDLEFRIQEPGDWERIVDTSLPTGQDFVDELEPNFLSSSTYIVNPHSIVVLINKRRK